MLEKFSVVVYSIYVGKNQNKIPKITKLNTTLVFSVWWFKFIPLSSKLKFDLSDLF